MLKNGFANSIAALLSGIPPLYYQSVALKNTPYYNKIKKGRCIVKAWEK